MAKKINVNEEPKDELDMLHKMSVGWARVARTGMSQYVVFDRCPACRYFIKANKSVAVKDCDDIAAIYRCPVRLVCRNRDNWTPDQIARNLHSIYMKKFRAASHDRR